MLHAYDLHCVRDNTLHIYCVYVYLKNTYVFFDSLLACCVYVCVEKRMWLDYYTNCIWMTISDSLIGVMYGLHGCVCMWRFFEYHIQLYDINTMHFNCKRLRVDGKAVEITCYQNCFIAMGRVEFWLVWFVLKELTIIYRLAIWRSEPHGWKEGWEGEKIFSFNLIGWNFVGFQWFKANESIKHNIDIHI